MLRLHFEKKNSAVWISHLDLMRLFQRAFKRAGLPLTHTKGFNPRPSVSIAMPLSVGVESQCELLDFELEGVALSCDEIQNRLNEKLIEGVRVLQVYDGGKKLKELAFLDCVITLEFDSALNASAESQIQELFNREELFVTKKSKNGEQEQNIIPMIRTLCVDKADDTHLVLQAKICCQNPSLNPMQIVVAIEKYLPELRPDHVLCSRREIYDHQNSIFR